MGKFQSSFKDQRILLRWFSLLWCIRYVVENLSSFHFDSYNTNCVSNFQAVGFSVYVVFFFFPPSNTYFLACICSSWAGYSRRHIWKENIPIWVFYGWNAIWDIQWGECEAEVKLLPYTSSFSSLVCLVDLLNWFGLF